MKWRLGKCPQDIYAQFGDKPSPQDAYLGTFATVEDAETAVKAVNGPYIELLTERDRYRKATS